MSLPCCSKILSCSKASFAFFGGFAALALATAFTSQYVFGLQPCELCVYQRWPYGVVIGLSLLGFLLSCQKTVKTAPVFTGLIALTFLANAVIAAYHSGVERHWWKSFLEGCTIPDMKGSITDVLAQIAATPPVRCDEIPWIDPVFGLSMANYNVVVCVVLAGLAAYSTMRLTRPASVKNP